MSDITVFNKGKRPFHVSTGVIAPNEAVVVASDEAEKLVKMYPSELQKVEVKKETKKSEKKDK